MKRLPPSLAAALALTVALVTAGCSKAAPGPGGSPVRSSPAPASPSAFPLSIADDDGVKATLRRAPTRIVTFAPSATEVLFALGLGRAVVGVSGPFDNFPPAAKRITHVGGAGQFGVDPNIEKVVSLNPDLVLTIEGGDQWKARLRQLGIPVFTTNSTDFSDLLHDIRTVGRLTGAVAAADRLTARMSTRAQAIRARAASPGPPVSCFYEVSFNPLYTVGPGSFIYDLLRRAGCAPVTSGAKDAYPQWSVEALLREDPRVYLVSSESGGSVAAVGRRPGYGALAAVRHHRVVLVSSDLVSRAGPRAVEGLAVLARALHPVAAGS